MAVSNVSSIVSGPWKPTCIPSASIEKPSSVKLVALPPETDRPKFNVTEASGSDDPSSDKITSILLKE